MEGSENQPPEQPQQPPAPQPTPMAQVTGVDVDVDCINCGQHFKFPIEPHVNGFKFECTSCGAVTQWSRD